MKLERQSSWIANKPEYHWLQPFVRDFANLAGPGVTGTATAGNAGNYSAFMFNAILPLQDQVTPPYVTPDVTHVSLFQEILRTGGSIAFALQSTITLLASMAYYDQLAQFDNLAPVQQTFFVTANVPQHYRRFLAVMIVLVLHLLLVAYVVTWFARNRATRC